jgi:hypothetical protein
MIMASDKAFSEADITRVWLHVFGTTMRERATISGSGGEAQNRLQVAVGSADEAVSSEKAIRGWLQYINNPDY